MATSIRFANSILKSFKIIDNTDKYDYEKLVKKGYFSGEIKDTFENRITIISKIGEDNPGLEKSLIEDAIQQEIRKKDEKKYRMSKGNWSKYKLKRHKASSPAVPTPQLPPTTPVVNDKAEYELNFEDIDLEAFSELDRYIDSMDNKKVESALCSPMTSLSSEKPKPSLTRKQTVKNNLSASEPKSKPKEYVTAKIFAIRKVKELIAKNPDLFTTYFNYDEEGNFKIGEGSALRVITKIFGLEDVVSRDATSGKEIASSKGYNVTVLNNTDVISKLNEYIEIKRSECPSPSRNLTSQQTTPAPFSLSCTTPPALATDHNVEDPDTEEHTKKSSPVIPKSFFLSRQPSTKRSESPVIFTAEVQAILQTKKTKREELE